ncbi:MAG: hypothetical protein FJ217_06735 [Ignavibacteria bacterium]|nr:hypothetical protein [Ignavibacteria bacterium]
MRLAFVIYFVIVLFISSTASARVHTPPFAGQDTVRADRADTIAQSPPQLNTWSDRRIVSVVLSTLIPGSGQTYLGHTEKGAGFTLATLASGLITILSENNIIGRNERLDELKAQYDISTNYIGADTIWAKMVSTKSILDKDVRRRDLFLKLTVAFWVANLVDIVFFTDDKGERTFGLLETGRTTFALVPDPKNGVNACLSIRF